MLLLSNLQPTFIRDKPASCSTLSLFRPAYFFISQKPHNYLSSNDNQAQERVID